MSKKYKKGDKVYLLQVENSLDNFSFEKLEIIDVLEDGFYEMKTVFGIGQIHISQIYSTVDELKKNLEKIYFSKIRNLEKTYKNLKADINKDFKKEIKLEQRELKLKRIIGDDEDTRV